MVQIVNHVWDKLLEVITIKKTNFNTLKKQDKNLIIILIIKKNKNVVFNYLENV
jgi:hypothetical protein